MTYMMTPSLQPAAFTLVFVLQQRCIQAYKLTITLTLQQQK